MIRVVRRRKNIFMSFAKKLIIAAKIECTHGRDRVPAVVTQLEQLIINLPEGSEDWAHLVCFKASLQIKSRQASEAVHFLRTHVTHGCLSKDGCGTYHLC